jgi:hypothetical protein
LQFIGRFQSIEHSGLWWDDKAFFHSNNPILSQQTLDNTDAISDNNTFLLKLLKNKLFVTKHAIKLFVVILVEKEEFTFAAGIS